MLQLISHAKQFIHSRVHLHNEVINWMFYARVRERAENNLAKTKLTAFAEMEFKK